MISAYVVEMMVCGSSHERRTRIKTRFKNSRRLKMVHKLDEEQVKWIIRLKRNGQLSSAEIAEPAGVSRCSQLPLCQM